MTPPPSWLPDIIDVTGRPQQVIDRLHAIFIADIQGAHCTFRECEVKFDLVQVGWEGRVYPGAFVHLISRDDHIHLDRQYDPERAARFHWCISLITNATDPRVVVWDYEEAKRRIRTYLWLKDMDYLVILEKRNRIFYVVTAYYADGDSTRRSLERKYAQRV